MAGPFRRFEIKISYEKNAKFVVGRVRVKRNNGTPVTLWSERRELESA